MKFEEAKEKMSSIHKLHTARDSEGELIFYKKPYSAKRIKIIQNNKEEVFDLEKVTHMSLDKMGVLIQYKPVDTNNWHPFPMKTINDIIVENE